MEKQEVCECEEEGLGIVYNNQLICKKCTKLIPSKK